MPRFSLLSTFYCVAGFAGYLAFFALANRNDTPFVTWLANSLGLLYGTLLYVSGLVGFYVACRASWRSTSPLGVAVAMPFSFLPAFIGVIGLVHGYLNVFRTLAYADTYPMPTEMYYANAIVLTCFLVGLCLTFISFALLAIAMIVKYRSPTFSSNSGNGG